MPISLKIFLVAGMAVVLFSIFSVFNSRPAKAIADPTKIPVGGFFLPGLFDIYIPTIVCGLEVTVVGPRPGTFMFAPVLYRYFPLKVYHVADNMVGLAEIIPPCPPTLIMLGSSLTPGFR